MAAINNTTAYPLVNTLANTDQFVFLGNSGNTINKITHANANFLRLPSALNTAEQTVRVGGINSPVALSNETLNVQGGLTVSTQFVAANILRADGDGLGFYGEDGKAKPTVSGSKGGNAALTSLISALATLGLISDTTT